MWGHFCYSAIRGFTVLIHNILIILLGYLLLCDGVVLVAITGLVALHSTND